MKNILILPDGSEISSGPNTTNALTWVEETESVNIGEDLVIGSAYANKIKARILTPFGGLTVNAGDEVILVKEDDGVRTQCGIYVMEKPERSSAHSTQFTGYNRIVKLDKDLGQWLNSLTGWPYRLIDFAAMVCDACGLTLTTTSIPNEDFPVPQFFRANVTGRQIMRWIGEICCRFCRADADGNIELAWYEDSGKTITPRGEYRYLANSLAYDTYETEKVDAVQLRLANSTDGALWPAVIYGTVTVAVLNIRSGPGTNYDRVGALVKDQRVKILENTTLEDGNTWGRISSGWVCVTGNMSVIDGAQNPYIISGNAILLANVTADMLPYIQTIESELKDFSYTPCSVSLMATQDIRAGHFVNITDINGNTIHTVVMTKTSKGLKSTLESAGNPNRESANAVNNKTPSQKAQEAVENQTHGDIFNKLTNNGAIRGFYVVDNVLYINGDFAKIVNVVAESIVSGILKSVDGKTYFDLDKSEVVCAGDDSSAALIGGGLAIEDANKFLRVWVAGSGIFLYPTGAHAPHLGPFYSFKVEEDHLFAYLAELDDNNNPTHIEGHKIGFKKINGVRTLVAYD